MYLSEEKRAEIRGCIKNQQSQPKLQIRNNINGFCGTEGSRKVPQILFDARDGKEVFTPFK